LFVFGWICQFVGHAIEGNQPAFFQKSCLSLCWASVVAAESEQPSSVTSLKKIAELLERGDVGVSSQ
jgi:uncharacterized membrane protein YGL010W